MVAPAVSEKVTMPPFAIVTLAGLNVLPSYVTVALIAAVAGAGVGVLSVAAGAVGTCPALDVSTLVAAPWSTVAGAEAEFHQKSATAATTTIAPSTNHPVLVI